MLIRTVALQAYELAATAIGVDPFEQMRRIGLAFEPPLKGDAFVSYALFVQLLENTAQAGHCPDFGLRMGHWPEAFLEEPLVLLMRHAETLQDALALVARYGHVYSSGFRLTLMPVSGDRTRLDLVVAVKDRNSRRFVQATQYTVVTVLRVLRHVCGRSNDDWTILLPHRKEFSHAHYREYLECNFRFEMPVAGIRLPEADLHLPLPGRSALRLKMAQSYIETHFRKTGELISERVRRMLRQRLGVRQMRQGDIAADLALHEKTLQRRLAREGRTFPALLDEVRRDHFLELLKQPARPSLAQIALMLGYSEQAALSRSSRRWFGCSPSEVLQRQPVSAPAAAKRRRGSSAKAV